MWKRNSETIPKKYRGLENKVDSSRKAAIRLFCLECVGFAQEEVRLCAGKDCPLFHWRITG